MGRLTRELSKASGLIKEDKNTQSSHSPILKKNSIDLAQRAVRVLSNVLTSSAIPTIYRNIDEFMYDFWPNLPWTPEGMKVALEWILNSPEAMRVVRGIKAKFGHDLEGEMKQELKNASEEFQSMYNENIDEAKEDRRGQIVDYLLRNPGATVADMGRAIWNRDINTLGRTSSLVVTIVRTISGALKAGQIRRDETSKPFKYYAISATGRKIGHPIEAPIKSKNKEEELNKAYETLYQKEYPSEARRYGFEHSQSLKRNNDQTLYFYSDWPREFRHPDEYGSAEKAILRKVEDFEYKVYQLFDKYKIPFDSHA